MATQSTPVLTISHTVQKKLANSLAQRRRMQVHKMKQTVQGMIKLNCLRRGESVDFKVQDLGILALGALHTIIDILVYLQAS